MAAVLCDGSHLIVPTNILIVCPVSKRVKKRSLKENESQNEVRVVLSICSFDNLYDYCVQNTGTEPAATNTTHNASGGMLTGVYVVNVYGQLNMSDHTTHQQFYLSALHC